MAGPVYAACVILPENFPAECAKDSKILTNKKRTEAAIKIYQGALAWGIGWSTVYEIETLNILQASLLAMRRAYQEMRRLFPNFMPAEAWVDGNQDPKLDLPTRTLVSGDALVPAIGAASILAKTARDLWMERWSWIEPGYGFEKHNGYGTKQHRESIVLLGPGAQHRPSFLRKLLGGLSDT